MPHGDRDRVAAAEALDPDIADEIANVRPITDWVPMATDVVGAGTPAEFEAAAAGLDGAWAAVSTTIAWPSDHSVIVVSATITTASGISRIRTFGSRRGRPTGDLAVAHVARRLEAASASMSRCARTWPAHAPIMWPPTTAASWTVHTSPGGRNQLLVAEERRAEQVRALLERVGHGDDDPLAVDSRYVR